MQAAQPPPRRSQFAFPRGFRGWAIGHFLAVANAWMDDFAIELLAPSPGARILEIGFGPGVAISMLSRRVPRATIGGIDPSKVMMQQAGRRNRSAIRRGQVDLRLGSAVQLPWPSASFDSVLCLNNAHLWDPVDEAFSECLRVIRPGGRILVGFHVWKTGGRPGGRLGSLEGAEAFFQERLSANGFVDVKTLRRPFLLGSASLILGSRP